MISPPFSCCLLAVYSEKYRILLLTERLENIMIVSGPSGRGEAWYRAWFGSKRPWVQIPPLGPRRSKRHIACSDFFRKSERAHFAAPPLQTGPAAQPLAAPPPYGCGVPLAGAALGSGLVLGADLVAASFLAPQSTVKNCGSFKIIPLLQ